jgi:hypothetical protein
MKTRVVTILMLCFFVMATAFAAKPIPASKAVRATVVDLVKKSLCYPEFAIKNKTECCVLVSLIIQDDGMLKVDASNSLSPELMKYVVNTIEALNTDKLAQYSGQRVLMKVKFELIA